MIRTDDLRQGFQVGPWHAQPLLNRLTGPGVTIPLEPRVMRVLVCLAERPGDVVTRDHLLRQVWGDTIVGEDSLSRTILDLRKAFNDDPQHPRFIATIRGVGYRLIAPVRYGAGPSSGDSSNGHNGALPVLATDGATKTGRALPAAPLYRRRGLVIAGMLLVGVIGFMVARMTPAPASPPLRSVPLTSYRGVEFDPALSPDGEQLAFVWRGPNHDNLDLYLKQVGTATPIRLTDHPPPGFDGSPSWSSDGRALAFMRSSEDGCGVYIRPIASSDERKVAACHFHSESSVAWSPDGVWIAFVDRLASDEPFRLYLVSTETLAVQQLTDPPPPYYGDLDPAFSPDGKTLAFVRGAMEGSLARLVSPALGDIYLISIPDGEARRLTFDNQDIPGLSWTPDGKGIVFTSNRENGSFDLWEVAVSDGDIHPVLATQSVIRNPSLPLHSSRLVYEDWQRDTNIWRLPLNPASGEEARPERFIASTRSESTPQYSPDGSRIVFTSDRSGYPEIWHCDAKGGQPVQLTRFAGPHTTSPRWSPDGQRIAFVSHAEGHADIYVIHANGGLPHRLTNDPGYDLVPSWSNDGQWIYFGSNRDETWQVWKIAASGDGEAVRVTQDGGFAAQESPRAADSLLYYTRVEEHGLWQISLADGEEEQTRLPLWKKDWGNWALRDDGIYFVHQHQGAYSALSRFDFDTSAIDSLTTRRGNASWTLPGLTVSPDGKWLLYTQPDQVNSDILMVDRYR